jgi:hypothetical protein
MKNLRSAMNGTVLLSAVIITGAPAMAADLTTHQWYHGLFFGVGSSVGPGGAAMVDMP